MPWTDDTYRFVVPAGMSEAEALMVRRQLQIMARLDTLEAKIDWIIRKLGSDMSQSEMYVGERKEDNHGR